MTGKYIIVSVSERVILSDNQSFLWVEYSNNDKLIKNYAAVWDDIADVQDAVNEYNEIFGATVWKAVLYDDIIKRLAI